MDVVAALGQAIDFDILGNITDEFLIRLVRRGRGFYIRKDLEIGCVWENDSLSSKRLTDISNVVLLRSFPD